MINVRSAWHKYGYDMRWPSILSTRVASPKLVSYDSTVPTEETTYGLIFGPF